MVKSRSSSSSMVLIFVCVSFLLASPSVRGADFSGVSLPDKLGEVNGEPIPRELIFERSDTKLSEIQTQWAKQKAEFKTKRYETLKGAFENILAHRLLRREARNRGISKQQLINQQIEQKLSTVSDTQARRWYRRNKRRNPRLRNSTFSQLRSRIKSFFRNKQRSELRDQFINEMKQKYEVKNNFPPRRVNVNSEGFPTRGPKDATVTVVEFSDFQCPYCRKAQSALNQLIDEYSEQVKIVFRHFPLESHDQAELAAQASMCAHENGKFWPYHDTLFKNQRRLGRDDLIGYAGDVGLDTDEFANCLDSNKYNERVQNDHQAGIRAGVQATPTFFINGRPLRGAVSFRKMETIVQEELSSQ